METDKAGVYHHAVEIVRAEKVRIMSGVVSRVGGGVWASVDEACDAVVRVSARLDQPGSVA